MLFSRAPRAAGPLSPLGVVVCCSFRYREWLQGQDGFLCCRHDRFRSRCLHAAALACVRCPLFSRQPGGYGAGVPPLPIPNREVKPGCADGTALQCGRVGGRPLFEPSWKRTFLARLFFSNISFFFSEMLRASILVYSSCVFREITLRFY